MVNSSNNNHKKGSYEDYDQNPDEGLPWENKVNKDQRNDKAISLTNAFDDIPLEEAPLEFGSKTVDNSTDEDVELPSPPFLDDIPDLSQINAEVEPDILEKKVKESEFQHFEHIRSDAESAMISELDKNKFPEIDPETAQWADNPGAKDEFENVFQIADNNPAMINKNANFEGLSENSALSAGRKATDKVDPNETIAKIKDRLLKNHEKLQSLDYNYSLDESDDELKPDTDRNEEADDILDMDSPKQYHESFNKTSEQESKMLNKSNDSLAGNEKDDISFHKVPDSGSINPEKLPEDPADQYNKAFIEAIDSSGNNLDQNQSETNNSATRGTSTSPNLFPGEHFSGNFNEKKSQFNEDNLFQQDSKQSGVAAGSAGKIGSFFKKIVKSIKGGGNLIERMDEISLDLASTRKDDDKQDRDLSESLFDDEPDFFNSPFSQKKPDNNVAENVDSYVQASEKTENRPKKSLLDASLDDIRNVYNIPEESISDTQIQAFIQGAKELIPDIATEDIKHDNISESVSSIKSCNSDIFSSPEGSVAFENKSSLDETSERKMSEREIDEIKREIQALSSSISSFENLPDNLRSFQEDLISTVASEVEIANNRTEELENQLRNLVKMIESFSIDHNNTQQNILNMKKELADYTNSYNELEGVVHNIELENKSNYEMLNEKVSKIDQLDGIESIVHGLEASQENVNESLEAIGTSISTLLNDLSEVHSLNEQLRSQVENDITTVYQEMGQLTRYFETEIKNTGKKLIFRFIFNGAECIFKSYRKKFCKYQTVHGMA